MINTASVLVFVALMAGGVGQAASPGNTSLEIVVQVYNFAGVEQATVARGEREAEWIFLKTGIAVRWVNCPLPDLSRGPDQRCQETEDPLLFTVGIVTNPLPGVASDIALGFALPFTGRANHAGVIYSKVAEFQQQNSGVLNRGELLGHVIAHELGHLLSRSSRHGHGIMQASWNETELKRMSQRQLSFDHEQVRTLQMGLTSRLMSGSELLLAGTTR